MNAKHVRYIACRKGVVHNPGCGFGLWGRVVQEETPGNINDLKTAMRIVRERSKDHTMYRAILSLDEETAIEKGFDNRERWQQMITGRIGAIAKENNIEIKDFRWCAAYHQERGHPHVHVLFWDDSDKPRNEFMGEERFAIASEKIRAAFNGEVFKEELKALRSKQDKSHKDLRHQAKSLVEGFTELSFFSPDEAPSENDDVNFYPKELKKENAIKLCERIEQLVTVLPDTGQLKYQYLSRNAKRITDSISHIIMTNTSLKGLVEDYLESVKDIAVVYGNDESAVTRQVDLSKKKILKDLGNDILKVIRENDWLQKRHEVGAEGYFSDIGKRVREIADTVYSEKMNDPGFAEKFQEFTENIGPVYTPKHVVMEDPAVRRSLRSMVKECMEDETLLTEINVAQALYNAGSQRKHTDIAEDQSEGPETPLSSQPTNDPANGAEMDFGGIQDGAGEERDTDNSQWKDTYRYLSNKIYNSAAMSQGWDIQQRQSQAVSFLLAICRVCSNHNRLIGFSGRWLFKSELSKQAKKEHRLKKPIHHIFVRKGNGFRRNLCVYVECL